MEFLPIVLAAFIGYISAILVEIAKNALRNRSRRKEYRCLCESELGLLQTRLIAVVYKIVGRFQGYDRDFLAWFLTAAQKHGILDKSMAAKVKPLIESGNAAISYLNEYMKAQPTGAVNISRLSLSFLMTNVDALMLFDSAFSKKVIEIVTQLGFLNDSIDHSWFFYTKTFDQSLSEVNRKAINENLNSTYGEIVYRARLISDLIDEFRS